MDLMIMEWVLWGWDSLGTINIVGKIWARMVTSVFVYEIEGGVKGKVCEGERFSL
jgi:hypothetical protein